MKISEGRKSFETCTNCSSEPTSHPRVPRAHQAGLSRRSLPGVELSESGDLFHNWGGCGSPVVKVSDHVRHVMSSSPILLKTRRVGQRCTLNLSRAETSSRWPTWKRSSGLPCEGSCQHSCVCGRPHAPYVDRDLL
ncbi:hypothetical protein TNCV_542721 [Trichonephila clavipes]|nr:hypothetical protein TNCV_542721 [Trichonephila clavipes]